MSTTLVNNIGETDTSFGRADRREPPGNGRGFLPGGLHRSARLVLLVVVLLFGTAPVVAETKHPFRIATVQVGFPAGPLSTRVAEGQPLFIGGAWTPIRVQLEAVGDISHISEVELAAETADGDDVVTRTKLTVPTVTALSGAMLYLKPGGLACDITVSVRRTDQPTLLAAPMRVRENALAPSKYLILAMGSSLSGLRVPKSEGASTESIETSKEPLRNGWIELATITPVDLLPDRAHGYEGISQAVLVTGSSSFVQALAKSPVRMSALQTWVRNGGRLIISVGANPKSLAPFSEMLPVWLQDSIDVPAIPMVLPNSPRMQITPRGGTSLPVAQFTEKPKIVKERVELPKDGNIQVELVDEAPPLPLQIRLRADDAERPLPLVVQGEYGLGRVTLVLFDLESPAVAEWKHREIFWEWLLNHAGTRIPVGNERLIDAQTAEDEDRYLDQLHVTLDYFEAVPVISFGVVAMLLLVYLILVGPGERWMLRRFFKRYEWTWITLPLIVLAVCLYTASVARKSKGTTQRINKIDLVDIDLGTGTVHGQVWFTVFSPKNENYTIGATPFEAVKCTPEEMLLSRHGRPKSARQTLFRRTYEYQTGGLVNVPIPIGSTKAFTAQWSAKMETPLFESTFRVARGDPNQITGSITSHFPGVRIEEAYLLYRERVTPLPTLIPGVPRYVSTNPQDSSATRWLQEISELKDPASVKRGGAAEQEVSPKFRIWPMLFHEQTLGQFARMQNASVRRLDQSWRIGEKSPQTAVLIARIGTTEGEAESMTSAAHNPTRLWMGRLPGSGERPELKGTLRQEIYLRILIPIAPGTE